MAILLKNPFSGTKKLSDTEMVTGLQEYDPKVEKLFFEHMHTYFRVHFSQFFFDKDSQDEIFQAAVVKLWTEIENKTIRVIDGKLWRKQRSGDYRMMTASLTTFLMAFAKNEFRELLRNHRDDDLESLNGLSGVTVAFEEENSEEGQLQIIDECISSMSPNCIEILTLFYYHRKSLDEILEIRQGQNISKDGLKTAKNKCMVTLKARVNERLNRLSV